MNKFFHCFRETKNSVKHIHLVDKCLILFMALLLVQLTFSLFVNNYDNSATNSIDVVIRTSVAGIFGYFLSANFVRHTMDDRKTTTNTPPLQVDKKKTEALEKRSQQIGFSSPSTSSSPETKSGKITTQKTEPSSDERSSIPENRLQILIITCVGVFCLVILTIVRNITCFGPHIEVTQGSSATVSQFRDIVSGCVGFLIGCPTSKR